MWFQNKLVLLMCLKWPPQNKKIKKKKCFGLTQGSFEFLGVHDLFFPKVIFWGGGEWGGVFKMQQTNTKNISCFLQKLKVEREIVAWNQTEGGGIAMHRVAGTSSLCHFVLPSEAQRATAASRNGFHTSDGNG